MRMHMNQVAADASSLLGNRYVNIFNPVQVRKVGRAMLEMNLQFKQLGATVCNGRVKPDVRPG